VNAVIVNDKHDRAQGTLIRPRWWSRRRHSYIMSEPRW